MKIDKSVLDQWNEIRERGDIKKICAESGLHRLTVQAAFTEGKCTPTTLTAIAKFFNKKAKQLNKLVA